MNDFTVAYRALLAREMRCPKCGAVNVPNASLTILVDHTAGRAECSNCSCVRPLAAFLPKDLP